MDAQYVVSVACWYTGCRMACTVYVGTVPLFIYSTFHSLI